MLCMRRAGMCLQTCHRGRSQWPVPAAAPPVGPLSAPALQVSEQMDSLRVLGTDPVDYLVTPRMLAAMLAVPILNVLCFAMGAARRLPLSCSFSAWSVSVCFGYLLL